MLQCCTPHIDLKLQKKIDCFAVSFVRRSSQCILNDVFWMTSLIFFSFFFFLQSTHEGSLCSIYNNSEYDMCLSLNSPSKCIPVLFLLLEVQSFFSFFRALSCKALTLHWSAGQLCQWILKRKQFDGRWRPLGKGVFKFWGREGPEHCTCPALWLLGGG